jgi:glutamate formiminotransferase/formiminotetrahydrofolate cyclodeaminase
LELVECVPNFSEGRRKYVIDAIVAEARNRNVRVLDVESDADHNRTVLTFVGAPEEVRDAALAACGKAVELIDLNAHRGQHPRMGAVDVVPFIPLSGIALNDCVLLAKEFAAEFASKFKVPVYLYEEAATRPARKNLADVRKGEFEGLREEIGRNPERQPDYGPNTIHPTAGATAVGARKVLIAYNVNLATKDVNIAKQIAKQIRGRDGGLAYVKALGFELKDRGMVQVSMNMVDYTSTPLFKAYEAIRLLAENSGVEIAESEVVGLVPMDALTDVAQFYLKLLGFSKSQILERRLAETQTQRLVNLDLRSFASEVASGNPVPGGGSVSAYTACLAASLTCMVSRLTLGKKESEGNRYALEMILDECQELQRRLIVLVDEDSECFMKLMHAYRMPKSTEAEKQMRSSEIQLGLRKAAEVSLKTTLAAGQILRIDTKLAEYANMNAISDLQTSTYLAHSAALGALANVTINLNQVTDQSYRASQQAKIAGLATDFERDHSSALATMLSRG